VPIQRRNSELVDLLRSDMQGNNTYVFNGIPYAAADPPNPAAGHIVLYAKGVGAAVQLWIIRSDGSKSQLS
jgi:hypothetical protein